MQRTKHVPRTSYTETPRIVRTAALPDSDCARPGGVSPTSPAMAAGRGWRFDGERAYPLKSGRRPTKPTPAILLVLQRLHAHGHLQLLQSNSPPCLAVEVVARGLQGPGLGQEFAAGGRYLNGLCNRRGCHAQQEGWGHCLAGNSCWAMPGGFQALVTLSWAGFYPQGSDKGFSIHFMFVFLPLQASWHKHISVPD